MSASSSALGADARALAGALAELFERDGGLAGELGRAQQRLLNANDIRRAAPARGQVSADVRQAFVEYRAAAEKRRQVAGQVGEATARLVDVMRAAGFSETQARSADVWALRRGVYRQGGAERCSRNR
jgi:hypothetical protein